MKVEVLFCAIVCANKTWIGVVGGYFSNKDCHFDTKDGASKEWRPHMCRCPSSFLLDVLESDYVSLVIARKSVFVAFFLEIPVETALSVDFRSPPLRSTYNESLSWFLPKVDDNFLNFPNKRPLITVSYYACIISWGFVV